ncbi:uncharacterized protein JCM6883_004143 [Sporobolomyces salmoneus]|uniref:uncharacterized protein n=1 Tax=Sporobolomyces salmoneus TaxID=183962 RepID=UPI003172D90A
MGVNGLWKEIESAHSITTWAQLSDARFREGGSRGMRVGVDTSLWLYHMEKMDKEQFDSEGNPINVGLNPGLRTIFFRMSKMLSRGILAVFIFDGPQKPSWKRGRHVGQGSMRGNQEFKRMVELMGMEWRVAAGEAEAELAAMNVRGEIDAVLSDDVDTFLFGAKMVIRNDSEALSGNKSEVAKNRTSTLPNSTTWKAPQSSFPSSSASSSSSQSSLPQYMPVPADCKKALVTWSSDDIRSKTGISRDGLILIALVAGGDYSNGLDRFGMVTAKRFAELGYGEKLFDGIKRHSNDPVAQAEFVQEWKEEVSEILINNTNKVLTRKEPNKAKMLLEAHDWPDLQIVNNYANPKITKPGSWIKPTWDRDVDLKGLVDFVTENFEWGHEEIVSKFRNLLWLGILLRRIRRTALEQDQGIRVRSSHPSALVERVICLKCEQSTNFTLSYSLHLDSTSFDNLINPLLPQPDRFSIPNYDAYTPEDAELFRAERKLSGRLVEAPNPPTTSSFRHHVPTAFVEVDPECREKVREWELEIEAKKAKEEAKARGEKSPRKGTSSKSTQGGKTKGKGKKKEEPIDSQEEDSAKIGDRLTRKKADEERAKWLAERAARKETEKLEGKGKGKANEVYSKPKRKSKPTKTPRQPPVPSTLEEPTSSDIEIVEPSSSAPSTSRLRPNKLKSPPMMNPFSDFSSTKATISAPSKSNKPSTSSSGLSFTSSKPLAAIPPRRSRPSPPSESDSESTSASFSSKHVDKASRNSIAHASPSKIRKKSSTTVIELSSDSEEEDEMLESLEDIFARREKERREAQTRATLSSSQQSLSSTPASSSSLVSKGKEKGKEAVKKMVETIILD